MVKRIKGQGKSGGGGASYPSGIEAANTLKSRNLIKFIDLIGEGEIVGLEHGGKDIIFDETPLQNEDNTYNFDGIFWEARVGLPDQPSISGFTSAERDINVNAEVTCKYGPIVRQTEGQELDAVRVTISVPALSKTDMLGNTFGTSVRFKIYTKGRSDLDYVLKLDKTITGKCVSTYQESYRINLTGRGPYLIKVERVTADSEKQNLHNKTYLSSITEIRDVKLTYPNCAYVGISYNSDQLSGTTPTRKYIVKGLKVQVPTNYNPETRYYDGAWDGSFKLAYTNNPAWCLYDIIVNNRYGLGDSIMENQVDKFAFYTVGKYCDELIPDGFGDYEPRFTLNTCINSRESCYSLLSKLASVFRGMVYQYEQLITISQDCPKEVSAIYTPANVLGGTFSYEGSAIANRPTVITVSYVDGKNNFVDSIETVQDDEAIYKYGWNQTDLVGFGCTSRGQAHRLAEWYLYTEQNEKELVTFNVGLDSVFVKPGDIVRVVDPSYMGARFGGRIVAFTTDTITIDNPIVFEQGATYQISYITKKGMVNTIQLLYPSGSLTVLPLSQLITEDTEPNLGAMWSIESSLVEGRLYRIISITEAAEANTFTISAAQHEPTKYAEVEQGLTLDKPNYSLFTTGKILPPTNLVAQEALYKSGSTTKTKLDLSWTSSSDPRVVSYRIALGAEEDNLQTVGNTSINSYTVTDIDPGTYKIHIYAIAPNGESLPLESIIDVKGKLAPPSVVKNLQATNGVDSVILTWDSVDDLDLVGYQIRKGAWEDEDIVVELIYGTTVTLPYDSIESVTYSIRAVDELGIFSETSAQIAVQPIPPGDVMVFTVVPQLDHIRFDWSAVSGVDVQYQVRVGSSWDTAHELFTTKSTTSTLLLPSTSEVTREEKVYWIKAVSPLGLWSANAVYTKTLEKLFEDRNLIVHYNNATDRYDNIVPTTPPVPYNGSSYNMEVVQELGSYALYMIDGVTFGEHYFHVTLSEKYRARAWLSSPLVTAPVSLQWQDAHFSWESPDAQFQWYPTGDIDGVTLTQYIYKKIADVAAYQAEEGILYNFSMDNTLYDLTETVTATDTQDISYGDARMSKGLLQTATTICQYKNIAFPVDNTFMLGFRLRKGDSFPASTCLLELVKESDGSWLRIGTYTSGTNLWVYCNDSSGAHNVFDTGLRAADKDFLFFGILQTSAKRTVYVYSTIRNIEAYQTIDFTPTKRYDIIALNQYVEL